MLKEIRTKKEIRILILCCGDAGVLSGYANKPPHPRKFCVRTGGYMKRKGLKMAGECFSQSL
jgi:hypothetical protein